MAIRIEDRSITNTGIIAGNVQSGDDNNSTTQTSNKSDNSSLAIKTILNKPSLFPVILSAIIVALGSIIAALITISNQ